MMAGVKARFPAMAVKLNGEMEAMNPSSGRYRIWKKRSLDQFCLFNLSVELSEASVKIWEVQRMCLESWLKILSKKAS